MAKFVVPDNEIKDFYLLVQRANRRIQANLKYIQKEDIKTESGQRALAGDYVDQSSWHSAKTVFSRAKTFSSKQAYNQYIRHISQWGGKEFERSVDSVKEGYIKAIIGALTTTAEDNGVMLDNGKLPAGIADRVKKMSLDQMTHFFASGGPVDDLEYVPYSAESYIGVDRDMFVDIVDAQLNTLEKLYPAKPKPKRKTRKRKK